MADSHHPCPPARREVVAEDRGSWLSGPCLNVPDPVEEITADRIAIGDRIIINGMVAEVSDRRDGWYWFNDSTGGFGLALGWMALEGSASGVAFRRTGDLMLRVVTPS